MRITISRLAELTGKSRHVIRKRCAELLTEERGQTVDSVAALALVFGEGESLDPSLERARLDKTRRESIELANAQKRRELIEVDAVHKILDQAAVGFREHLMGLSSRWADTFASESDAFTINHTLEAEIRQALTHLADARNHPLINHGN